jgi:alanine racemase
MSSKDYTLHSELIVNLRALKENYLLLKSKVAHSTVAATVKADGYGLGIIAVVVALYEVGCRDFFVANLEEAIEVRKLFDDVNIYNLKGLFMSEEEGSKSYNIITVVNCLSQLEFIKDFTIPLVIHIDTGLARLGIDYNEYVEFLQKHPKYFEKFNIKYLMTHLSVADDPLNEYNRFQLNRVLEIKKLLPQYKFSLCNSTGIFLGADYHFDLVRPGQAIYGMNPTGGHNPMHPVVKLVSPIIQIRYLKEDAFVGYSRLYQAKKGHILATCPLGYADGLKRNYTGGNYAYLKGKMVSIIGRISMDLVIIDVTNVHDLNIEIGDKVEFINENITVDEFAKRCNTVGYEVLTNLGRRIKRVYIG